MHKFFFFFFAFDFSVCSHFSLTLCLFRRIFIIRVNVIDCHINMNKYLEPKLRKKM